MSIDQSAKNPQRPARPGGEFFLRPDSPAHRRYEALRAYLADGLPAAEAAARFGYTPASLLSAVRDFRAGERPPPGPPPWTCAPPAPPPTSPPPRWPRTARR